MSEQTDNIVSVGNGKVYDFIPIPNCSTCDGCVAKNDDTLCTELTNEKVCDGGIFLERIEPVPVPQTEQTTDDTFEMNGKTYIKIVADGCTGCVFDGYDNRNDCWASPDCEGHMFKEALISVPVSTYIGVDTSKALGRKYDNGKPRYSLIPPYALEQVAICLTKGAEKYDDNNWKYVDDAEARYLDALMRHVEARRKGEVLDAEGNDHLAAIVTNGLFLLEFEHNPEFKKESE